MHGYGEQVKLPGSVFQWRFLNLNGKEAGTYQRGSGSSGFNVRGSSADQNMIYINKVPVYNSSHLFGFFTSFSSDIVRDFTLYKSNLPANLGGRLASFFDITAKQGNMNMYTARVGISPITGYLSVGGPIQKNKSSFILSARSTYSDWMLRQMEDPELRNSEAGFLVFSMQHSNGAEGLW